MAKLVLLSLHVFIFIISFLPFQGNSISSCNGPCKTLNDCAGQLICISGKCNDDPDVGTHICSSSSSPPPPPTSSTPSVLSSCNGPCKTLNDCVGQLICISGKCNDDPNVGTHICSSPSPPPPPPRSSIPPPPLPPRTSTPPPPPPSCQSSGTLVCGGTSYPTYTCSPPVTASTSAILTNNDFSAGGDGGAQSECDGQFHSNSELIVALSTGWYNGGSRCGKMIKITAQNGRTTTTKVVDECDSTMGCDAEHAGQPPCNNNIVDASDAVWQALNLDINLGRVPITWTMA